MARNIGPSLVGKSFGRLTVLIDDGKRRYTKSGNSYRCGCPDKPVIEVRRSNLITGHTKSHGCLNEEEQAARAEAQTTHGMSQTMEYNIWANKKQLCRNPNNPDYPDWRGRGIDMCDLWYNSFSAFLADVGPCPEGKETLNRIDNDGNYEPGNVEWTNWPRQLANKRYTLPASTGERGIRVRENKFAVRLAHEQIGSFDTLEAALRARNWLGRKLWGQDLPMFQDADPAQSLPPDWEPPKRPVLGSRIKSIVGQRFGHLVVLDDSFTHKWYGDRDTGQESRTILVRCDCGTVKETNRQGVIDGRTKTCGCFCPFHQHKRGPNKKK